MSQTLANEIALSMFDRWNIDAEIEQAARDNSHTKPVDGVMTDLNGNKWNVPKPNPKLVDDDGFIQVKKGAKHSHTTKKSIHMEQAYKNLGEDKPVTKVQGSGKAHAKNMKRKAKKSQNSNK